MRKRYVQRPVVIEAELIKEPTKFVTLEGTIWGMPGEYLIHDIHGEKYPCSPRYFHETYEQVSDDTPLHRDRINNEGS